MRHSPKAQYRQGFTLVEVLVSLVIFSSVIAVVITGLEQGRGQWLRAMDRNHDTHKLYTRQQWITQTIEQSNSAPFIIEYGVSAPYFYGTERQIDFLTNAPVYSGPGTYSAARLQIVDDNQGTSALVFTQWANKDPYYGIPKSTSEGKSITLLEGIKDAKWEYYLESRIEATPLEIKYNTFAPRREAKWSNYYDAKYELKIPKKMRFDFEIDGKSYTWYFNLASYSSATGQEEPLVIL
ncbi:PulJ/GspJ family protein [Vibrio rotiferianus]|uniref:PulJ/GspJ family protein n=1 Tax=Vibrio rotiferianus TaxID=190895 RepID=UPI0005ED4A84|nr:prepilin-type N-terminal cleavage/methylation domain-containing protein [Vibrio rotiferianus]